MNSFAAYDYFVGPFVDIYSHPIPPEEWPCSKDIGSAYADFWKRKPEDRGKARCSKKEGRFINIETLTMMVYMRRGIEMMNRQDFLWSAMRWINDKDGLVSYKNACLRTRNENFHRYHFSNTGIYQLCDDRTHKAVFG